MNSHQKISHSKKKHYLAHYKIIKEIGKGGMGTVYQAGDTKLKRMVAIKILNDLESDDGEIARLKREATAMAKLDHDNIVKIFEVRSHPCPCIVMQYIEGVTLEQLLKTKKLSSAKIGHIFHAVTDALSEAHRKNIIHRDIKPANIMIDKDEKPILMDFGLAKMDKENQDSLSQVDSVVGTLAYMAPEQLHGSACLQSDVYSIGATLYQVLTGRPPYQGESYWKLIAQIATSNMIRPRILNPDISIYLEAICLKCLEKNPKRRYSSGTILAKEFHNFVHDQPIRAKPYTKIDSCKRFFMRNKMVCLFAATALISLITFTVLLSLTLTQVQAEKLKTEKALLETQKAKEKIEIAHQILEKQKQQLKQEKIIMQNAQYQMVVLTSTFFKNITKEAPGLWLSSAFHHELALTLTKISELITESIMTKNYDASMHYVQANIFSKINKNKGIELYTKALALDPKFTAAYIDRGKLYALLTLYEEALRDYQKAIELAPNHAISYFVRGNLYYALGKPSQALVDIEKALELNPYYPKAYLVQAQCFDQLEKHPEALFSYNQSIKLSPNNPFAHYLKATLCYFKLGQKKEALDSINHFIRLDANKSNPYFIRGKIYHDFFQYEKALQDLNKAILLEANSNFYEQRAFLFRDIKQYDKAILDWEKAISLGTTREEQLRKMIQQYQRK